MLKHMANPKTAAAYTITRLGRLCGVSRSTLLYYDAIGLLSPAARTAAGYRVYAEAERARLEKILLFHSLGIPLARIRPLLDEPRKGPAALLVRRLMEINAQIDELRGRQRTILDLLEEEGSLAGAKRILQTFTDLGREAGIVKGNYLKIHRLFEKSSPDMHRRLLRFLGFTEKEITVFVKRLTG
jgi:MerR family transcriptional regulator, thiopeptide resistance regulator